MGEIRWAESAVADLGTIARHVARDSPDAAETFVDRVDKAAVQLSELPLSGRVIPELERHNIRRYREVVIAPWRLFYEIRDHAVIVLAIIDGRRDIQDVLLRRLTQ